MQWRTCGRISYFSYMYELCDLPVESCQDVNEQRPTFFVPSTAVQAREDYLVFRTYRSLEEYLPPPNIDAILLKLREEC